MVLQVELRVAPEVENTKKRRHRGAAGKIPRMSAGYIGGRRGGYWEDGRCQNVGERDWVRSHFSLNSLLLFFVTLYTRAVSNDINQKSRCLNETSSSLLPTRISSQSLGENA